MAAVDAGKPLLLDYDSQSHDSTVKDDTVVSLRALEEREGDFEKLELRVTPTVLQRLLMAVRRRNVRLGEEKEFERRYSIDGKRQNVECKWRVRRCGMRTILGLPLLVLCFFGIVHISNVFMNLVHIIKDDSFTYSHNFLPLDQYQKGDYTGLTSNVKPIHCHSHNDYWRRVPLFEALRWGCTGVEADVWYFPERSQDLFVGHSTRDLTADKSFHSMYVDHLVRIIDQQNTPNKPFDTDAKPITKNGVFEQDPSQTLVLLIDFKNDGHAIYPVVSEQLEPLRKKGYLSYFDGRTVVSGPITIVATGNAPFDLITRNTTYRDIFFDAPLSALAPLSSQTTNHEVKRFGGQGTVGTTPLSTFDVTNSYYASVDFKKAVGWCWFGRLSDTQREAIKTQIRAAKERGLKSRYWGAPKWPVGVRNMVWRVLVEEGVDYLNGDDLRQMTRGDWGAKVHGSWMGK